MKSFFTRLFLFFLFLAVPFLRICLADESAQVIDNSPKLHVCTVVNKNDEGLEILVNSCEKQGIDLKILWVSNWKGLSSKLTKMIDYLESIDDRDIVLFVDGFDVFVLKDKETILEKFYNFKAPIVFAAERKCWPFRDLAHKFPEKNSSFRYINTGTYIGYAKVVKNLFKSLEPIDETENDQRLLMENFLKYPNRYTLDYSCELFLPLANVCMKDVCVEKDSLNIKLLETGSSPAIIHGNGRIPKQLYRHLYSVLFVPNYKGRYLLQWYFTKFKYEILLKNSKKLGKYVQEKHKKFCKKNDALTANQSGYIDQTDSS